MQRLLRPFLGLAISTLAFAGGSMVLNASPASAQDCAEVHVWTGGTSTTIIPWTCAGPTWSNDCFGNDLTSSGDGVGFSACVSLPV